MSMQIGAFRRHVGKTMTVKPVKVALRAVAKNTTRVQAAQSAIALKGHTGQLLQASSQYLLGLQMTLEAKAEVARVLGDMVYDLTALCRVLKVKMPTASKKSKLVGTRGAALLQLDGLTTSLLRVVEQGLFAHPPMTTTKKIVSLPTTGVKEEHDIPVIDTEADAALEAVRQTEMKSYLTGAMDVFWRVCYDITGKPPVDVLEAKFARMQQEFPSVTFDVAKKSKKTAEAVPA